MAGRRYNALWQQTMLRIKDPKVSVPFYEKNFNMKLVHEYHFPQWKFSLYFMERVRDGVTVPTPGTKESEAYLWNMTGTTLELTHNHGSEEDAFVYQQLLNLPWEDDLSFSILLKQLWGVVFCMTAYSTFQNML
ncbi:unnamed protein product [Polarella glacialis]|uniref:Glyoxalase/fosfomycin resistance/dioxygenase domain-containing protein n=1 Tax=Polarella glacialis TaxID=89957 RepID=A0A813DWS4_POLGL|nr:unnamed protein product [Polarella glacialis]